MVDVNIGAEKSAEDLAAEKAAKEAAAKEAKAAEKAAVKAAKEAAKEAERNTKVRIFLPLIPGAKDQTVEICINGKFTLLKRGEPIDVSPEIAEVLTNAASAELKYQELERSING